MRKLIIILLALSSAAWGGTTLLSGTFKDAQGNPLNGTLSMKLPVPATDTGSGISVSPTPVFFTVANGSLVASPVVEDVNTLQPKGLWYHMRLYDTKGTLLTYGNYIVTGPTFNISTAVATTVTTSNVSYLNPAGTNANNVFSGTNIFGANPGIDAAAWNAGKTDFGLTDATGNANVYGIVSQLLMNPTLSTVGFQKAPIIGECQHNDTSATANPRDCIGLLGYGIAQAGNTNAQVWGVNAVGIIQATADGAVNGVESDVQNNASTDPVWTPATDPANAKWAFSTASIGTQKGTAIFQASKSGVGYHYGFIIRNVDTAAIVIPNNIPITATNQATTSALNILYLDTSNRLQLGTSAPTIVESGLTVVGGLNSLAVTFANLPTPPSAGQIQFCSDCKVTTAASCSTATPASCVCTSGGTGAFAKYYNFQANGIGWYCGGE